MNREYFGRIWKFGDNMSTDVIGPFMRNVMDPLEQAKGCMRSVRPEFSEEVKPGDVMVAGINFGCGSSRETAAKYIALLGVKVVVAKSFGRIFYRNAINNGVLPIEAPDVVDACADGGTIHVIVNEKIEYDGKNYPLKKLPENVLSILEAGGCINFMRIRNGLAPEGVVK